MIKVFFPCPASKWFHWPTQLTIKGAESGNIAMALSLHQILLRMEVSDNFSGSSGVGMLHLPHQRTLDQLKMLQLLSASGKKRQVC